MNMDEYIGELLFEHDCVIVPDFGGFVCNYSSAIIHSGKHQFHPPFKKISFNRNLKNNDGLLANQIVQLEKISYPEANRRISAFVEQLNKEINLNKRFDFKNIGSFYLGEENSLLFEQNMEVNYLPESFGLTFFYAPAIKREAIERKIERQFKDKVIIPLREEKNNVGRKRAHVTRYLAIGASVFVLISFLVISSTTSLLNGIGLANLNPLGVKTEPFYHVSESSLPDNNVAKDNLNSLLAVADDTLRYLNIMIDGKIPIVVRLKEDATTVVKTLKKEQKNKKRFHIVGGAFAISENAEKFKNRLLQLGYNAAVIEKKNSNLQCVSYGSFTTLEEAMQALESIRAVQNDAWLMTN